MQIERPPDYEIVTAAKQLFGAVQLSDEIEVKCEACGGTGIQIAKQPSEPTKRIFPARCKVCEGKGRIRKVPS